jgi:tetratricopeptide (TPR) repeat protein
MSDMPQNPRAHQLERESRLAFRGALPSTWVPRSWDQDYGLDEHVEIFSNAGVATGRSFLVQLKATDQADIGKAIAVRLKTRTVSYLREQDLPVLIVRFHAPTGTLFARWFHTFDPHYGRRNQKTITFHLTEGDRWSESTPTQLEEEVERFRYLRTQRLTFPVRVELRLVDKEVQGVGRGALLLDLRKYFNEIPDLVELGTNAAPTERTDPPVVIEVSTETTVINANSAPTVTLHHTFDYEQTQARERLAIDVVVAFALWLDQVGETNEAARLARNFLARSNTIQDDSTLLRLLGCFVRSHRIPEALDLAEELETSGESWASQVLSTSLLLRAGSLTPTEKSAVEGYLRRACAKADELGDADAGRVAYYNLGNFLRSRNDEEAFACYASAAELDPHYLDRPYFCRELAGLLFLLGEFDTAAFMYERAIGLEAGAHTRALWADALLFAGRYREALTALEEYLAAEPDPPPEFVLKSMVLPRLVARFGDVQRRRPDEAVGLAGVPPGEPSHESAIEEALERDALCNVAWFNLGVTLAAHEKDNDRALFAFLLAALTAPSDVEAWSNAFGLALASEKYLETAPLILTNGYWLNGPKMLERVALHGRSQPNGFPLDEYLRAVDSILAMMPKDRSGPTVRFLGEGPDYVELDLGRPESELPQND